MFGGLAEKRQPRLAALFLIRVFFPRTVTVEQRIRLAIRSGFGKPFLRFLPVQYEAFYGRFR